jgi:3-methyladenine DNA glycosylase AlkD
MGTDAAAVMGALFALAGSARTPPDGYLGNCDRLLGIATPALRRLARAQSAQVEALGPVGGLAVLAALFAADVHDAKVLAALMLHYGAGMRAWVGPAELDGWLDRLSGWAQIDALCSNVFQADEMLGSWRDWESWLRRWAKDEAIGKRRASLVLLTGPVRKSDDARLADMALRHAGLLAAEREILITKAVSWILRSLVARHREAVMMFLAANKMALPAIAVREATAKLETGRKVRRRPDRAGR